MEFLSIYNMVISAIFMLNFPQSNALTMLVVITAICATLFVLQGIGLQAMAKKQNIGKRWLAFVPFANIWLIGKIAGSADFFGQKIKRIGLYAMIAEIVCSIVYALIIASQIYLVLMHGMPYILMETGEVYWENLTGFSLTVGEFLAIGNYLISIFSLISEILMFVLMLGVYKKYAPKNYFALGLLALFIPLSRYVALFVLRKRTPIDFDAYMRARREAYMRSRQRYYGGYNSGYNGYNPYAQPQQPPQPDDPFSEFKSEKKPENEPKQTQPADENPFDEF